MMVHYCQTKTGLTDPANTILFYRLGDFYEMFFEDATLVSKELELTLTGKDCGMEDRAPMCGIPYHAAEGYINRLVENGHKVAICEQMEDPKQAKGMVKREVIKLLWNTSSLFTNPRFVSGAATSPFADIYAYAGGQLKKSLEIGKRLGAENYVFWGGREGYENL